MRPTAGHAFTAVGVVVAGIAAFVAWKLVYEPRTWPEVNALVVSNAIVSGEDAYSAQFTFRYRVDGVEHETTIRGTSSSSSHAVAESAVAALPAGRFVPIRVKPGAPDEIAYDARWSNDNILLVSIVVAMASIFGGIGLAAVRRDERETSFTAEALRARAEGILPIDDDTATRRGALVFIAVGIAVLVEAAALGRGAWLEVGFDRERWSAEWFVPIVLGGVGAGIAALGALFLAVARFVQKKGTVTVPLDPEEE